MLRFKQFLSEETSKVDLPAMGSIPERTVRVLHNPSSDQIEGLLNRAEKDRVPHVRFYLHKDRLDVWHDTHTIHHDIHRKLHGSTEKEYSALERDKKFGSGFFVRPFTGTKEPFTIGITGRSSRPHVEKLITKHPTFKNILPHPDDGKPRSIEGYDA
mgnify:FL=1